MQDRVKPLEGVRNFRDFGGYVNEDGRAIRRGLLFRSGHYNEATEADMTALDGMGIVLQVDLRRPDERERQPGRWPGQNVHVVTHDGGRETEAPHHRFLQQVEADVDTANEWMAEYYRKAPFKPHHVALYTEWFDRLAGLGGDEAALVNCTAGKDRTGIACALTKHVLGVQENDMMSDYLLTNEAADVDTRLKEAAAYFNTMLGKDYAVDVYRPFMGVREGFLRTALETIIAQSGSIEAYLRDVLDLTDAKRAALRERLLEAA